MQIAQMLPAQSSHQMLQAEAAHMMPEQTTPQVYILPVSAKHTHVACSTARLQTKKQARDRICSEQNAIIGSLRVAKPDRHAAA